MDEFFSCDAPVVAAYIDGVIKTSVRLWKFIMQKDAREVLQKEVFHPTKVSAKVGNPSLDDHCIEHFL